MYFNIDGVNIYVEKFREDPGNKNSLFLLHGFTGSSGDWKNVCDLFDKRFNIFAIDLIGHGKSDAPSDISFYSAEAQVNQINSIFNKIRSEKNILLGYSMGGRLALTYSVRFPVTFNGLILESASAGISKQSEREKRIANDNELADLILKSPLEDFMTKWMDQELLGTLKRFSNAKLEELKKEKSNANKTGLAYSLRGFSTGVMPFLGNELKSVNIPVLLLSGQLDSKFTKINSHIQKHFPKAKHSVIKTAGHNTHLEEPKYFVQSVNRFLKKF